jgi:hypothetical protein
MLKMARERAGGWHGVIVQAQPRCPPYSMISKLTVGVCPGGEAGEGPITPCCQ